MVWNVFLRVSACVRVHACVSELDVNWLYVLLLTQDNIISDKKFLNGFFNKLILLL